MPPEPGEVYWANLPGGKHLAIVVSRVSLNEGNHVTVVPVTSKNFASRSRFPNCVAFNAGEACFKTNCVAKAENLVTVDIELLDTNNGAEGYIKDDRMREVIRAIGYVIEAECEPA